ncbi:hypothetical protein QQX98_007600 [Neonectria punicea]|uniref:Uncharacterized protein n=1 Tax=Neonectria punicea TaxID=979145 RepID=A0ABR1GXV6_9HYPO
MPITRTHPHTTTRATRAPRKSMFGRRRAAPRNHQQAVTTTTTTTTTRRRGFFGTKKPQVSRDTVVSQHRKPTMKDKVSGALLKLKGSLTHRPAIKAAGTRRMHGTDGRGTRRVV